MMSPTKITALYRVRTIICLVTLLLFNFVLSAQQVTVLPGNDNYSQQSGPQGGQRAQRQFYLIKPAEVQASGLPAGIVNQIGFTIGAPQSSPTKGAFKVWLQNTTDIVSRIDSSWKEKTTSFTSDTARYFPGQYEVQIIPVCVSAAQDTVRLSFNNSNLPGCRPPSGLKTQRHRSYYCYF